MTTTMQYTGTLTVIECAHCHMKFAMPEDFEQSLRRSHGGFFCPAGHSLVFNGKSDLELEREKRADAERTARNARASRQAAWDQAAAAERSKAAIKGHLTRARRKIAAGDCPVPDCGQHFANVREHMKHRHPGWHLTDPETGKAAEL